MRHKCSKSTKLIFLRLSSKSLNGCHSSRLIVDDKSLLAQGVSNQGVTFSGTKLATPPTTIPRLPDDRVSTVKGPVPPEQRIEDGCFLPPLTIVHSALTDASNLEVSPKAKKDYRSPCNAVHGQKWLDAEQHLRQPVEPHPTYAAA